MLDELSHTIGTLQAAGKTVYLVSDVPDFSFAPRRCKYEKLLFSRGVRCGETSARSQQGNARFLALLDVLIRVHPDMRVTRAEQYFCAAGECSMVVDGQLMYRDAHHLNLIGTRFLGEQIVKEHPELAGPPTPGSAVRLRMSGLNHLGDQLADRERGRQAGRVDAGGLDERGIPPVATDQEVGK